MSNKSSQIWNEYENSKSFIVSEGYEKDWPLFERFKAGDQWPKATDRTKNLPRPVFNIVELIVGHKVPSIINQDIKMVFWPEDYLEDTDSDGDEVEAGRMFSAKAGTTWSDVDQDELNEQAITNAADYGPAIWHYYWDSNAKGGNQAKWVGKLAGEVIDQSNFYVSNPQERKVQKQKWVILRSFVELAKVKEMAKANGVPEGDIANIQSDGNGKDIYDKAINQPTDTELCVFLTKYWFDDDGFVWFSQCVQGCEIKQETNTGMTLIPVEVMQWKSRKSSIYGESEIRSLIANQKAINLMLAMWVRGVELTAWPKLITEKGALRQRVTNAPGERLTDYSEKGNGIKYLSPGNASSQVPDLVDRFITYTKEMASASESSLGQQKTSDLNATAIMLLQQASGVPLEQIKKRFYRSMKRIGRIWEEFFKVKYNTSRKLVYKEHDETIETDFKGTDYASINLNLRVDVGPSSTYSEALVMSTIDKFYSNKDITFEQYLKYAPDNAVPFKASLLNEIKKNQMSVWDFMQQFGSEEKAQFVMLQPEQQMQVISKAYGKPMQIGENGMIIEVKEGM